MTFAQESMYLGFVVTLLAYLAGLALKRKTGWAVINPILVASILLIAGLSAAKIDYQIYNASAKYISYLLTPATVCLAIPLYRQLELLKQHLAAVMIAIMSGVIASTASIFVLCSAFHLNHDQYVSLLPKSITTAIAMGVTQEAGGIVTITVVGVIVTGILGNMIAESLFKIVKINHPIARGLALGTSAHAIGTAKALELGEVEGAMSSLSIAVSGLMTVIAVPLVTGWI